MTRTTVICAVWHRDPRRHALLEAHAANLDAQTAPVERIYVFDGGDVPPGSLRGDCLASPEPLSIYQAWNLALARVRTPYVMNLNLDDRLAPDAVETLERALDGGADLASGDWWVCQTQAETDAVQPCRSIEGLPWAGGWPPGPAASRLGSGRERDTLGPACLWRAALHEEPGLRRFPWKFDDGTLIRVIGDWIWWRLLAQRGKRLAPLPLIIGNYFSHPGDQAEFRSADDLGRGIAHCTE